MNELLKCVRFIGVVLGVGLVGAIGSACIAESDLENGGSERVGDVEEAACLGNYDAVIAAARNAIAANCGGVSACGTGDTTTHSDMQLTNGQYCACYNYLWNNRNAYPFNSVQVIYHEPQACSWKHIHLQKVTTCGTLHFDLDEGSNDCYDNEPTSSMDEFFCSTGSRKGSCDS